MSTWGLVDTNKTYMKNLLFVLCLVVSATLFYSCGDDNNENPQTQTETEIAQNSIKGKFYNVGIEAYKFNDKTVDVWSNIVNGGEYYQYANVAYSIYPEKQYIVIKTTPETLLYYEIVNNKVLLYTDAERKNNITDTEKPNDFTNESKEPTNSNEIWFTLTNTIVDFDTKEYLPINQYREMYIKDAKTGKTLLKFLWMNYKNIRDIGTMGTRNLVGFTSGRGYIDKVYDGEGNRIYNNDITVNVYDNRHDNTANTTTTILNINTENIKGYVGVVYEKK